MTMGSPKPGAASELPDDVVDVLARVVGRTLASALARLFWLDRRFRARLELLELSDHQLRDVGITRDQALREAERLSWRGDWT
jgi:uncharacterized protein YjiS (DUF1127 family)